MEFGIAAGEFLDTVKNKEKTYDCVVTCFFIDTAMNIIEYILAIKKVLKLGGIWVNHGPLKYHYT